ncbi:MAG: hypothetical protein RBS39_00960 [Phycisphaerales bacterium]|jgi:hypothetical protein|nr:hypothetical protein [Phycisphaerales bacterium]
MGDSGSDRFALRVLQYEFPGITTPGAYDSNWLVIEGRVESERGDWTFVDPCLLTRELESLISWLRALATPLSSEIGFTEPLLRFTIPDPGEWVTQLTLRAEALPKSLFTNEMQWGEGITLSLMSTRSQRDWFADSLEADLKRFPRR